MPGYLAEPSADGRWCHLWFEHPVAIARLHAVWLAWQELTDPAILRLHRPLGVAPRPHGPRTAGTAQLQRTVRRLHQG